MVSCVHSGTVLLCTALCIEGTQPERSASERFSDV
jgi:hypothetical protein